MYVANNLVNRLSVNLRLNIKMIRFVILSLVVNLVMANLPAGFSACKKSASNYDECIKKAVGDSIKALAKGNKENKFPKIEPLFVKNLDILGNGGSIDLNQHYYDTNVVGLSQCKISQFDAIVDDKKCEINVKAHHDFISLIGSYKADGKMLVFQLNGFGAVNITTAQMTSVHKLTCKVNGDFLTVTDYKVSLKPEKVHFDIENLVNGNELLSKNVLNVMNENHEEVFNELRKDYESTFGEIFKQIANAVFAKIPVKEIFLD